MKKLAVGITTMALLFTMAGCSESIVENEKTEIDLNDYVVYEFVGYDGDGLFHDLSDPKVMHIADGENGNTLAFQLLCLQRIQIPGADNGRVMRVHPGFSKAHQRIRAASAHGGKRHPVDVSRGRDLLVVEVAVGVDPQDPDLPAVLRRG